MEIENLFRSTAPAVGLKPSASQDEARLRGLYRSMYSKTISPRLWNAKPACTGYGGIISQRPSALASPGQSPPARNANPNGDPIGYRLSAIAYRLSAMECKTRLCRPDRTPTPAHEAPVPPNRDDAGASSHSDTRPCWQRRVRAGERLLPSSLRRHSNPAASGARQR